MLRECRHIYIAAAPAHAPFSISHGSWEAIPLWFGEAESEQLLQGSCSARSPSFRQTLPEQMGPSDHITAPRWAFLLSQGPHQSDVPRWSSMVVLYSMRLCADICAFVKYNMGAV